MIYKEIEGSDMAEDDLIWNTGITTVKPNHIITRGYRQEDLIGNVPFSHNVFLILKGRMPTRNEGKIMDAILTSTIDHGITPPSARAARTVASAGVPLPTAVAAGILAIGDVHGGAIEKGALLLQEGVKRAGDEGLAISEVAKQIVANSRENKKRLPGFGHRVHTADPRTTKLFAIADELEIAGPHVELSRAIELELREQTGRNLPINVDGAIAAIISDMGFDYRLGKAFFLMGRTAGLVAQAYEEMTRERPMRKMYTSEHDYDGPEERDLPEEYG